MTRTASSLKNILLAYARSFGVHEQLVQRKVAAQLWRAMPRGLTGPQAVSWLDEQVAHWAFALLGRPMGAARIRTAFLTAQIDPLLLLQPHDGTARYSRLASQLEAALPVAVPEVSLSAMPVQDLSPLSLLALFSVPAATPAVSRV